ncbi:MAG: sigma-54 dependent transcriptional regulator [Candidatus Thiodiazotropha sp. (ex Lucinoma borealis)]|nr:sigma-54 dependent transcriptional regulator [Candidatus Thiodiazotropha sp. (ex Lucinoma borealis)]
MSGKSDITVLLVDDEKLFVRAACKLLGRAGLSCIGCHLLEKARQLLNEMQPKVVLLDVRLPDGSGLELLEELSQTVDPPSVVVLTAFADIEDAVMAMKQGAADYLQKPCDMDHIIQIVKRLLKNDISGKQDISHNLSGRPDTQLVGETTEIEALRLQLENIGRLSQRSELPPPTVLLTGETGVGKGLAARHLHATSARHSAPFIQVDCATLPRELIESELFGHTKGAFTGAHRDKVGLIEQATGGTLFLDEIGELPLELQAKLLALLDRRHARRVGATEEYSVDAWFITATHHNLNELSQEARFRQDLFYRLSPLTIHVPSLSERRDDIPLLARHYLKVLCKQYKLKTDYSTAAMQALMKHSWPGNIRELKGVVERALYACNGDPIDPVHLGLTSQQDLDTSQNVHDAGSLQQAEIEMVSRTLLETKGNVSEAARRLGMTRMMLRYRIRKFGLSEKSSA